MVGDTSAASTGDDACERARGGAYGDLEREWRGGEGLVAHCECRGENGELGEGLVRSCGRRRSRGRGGEDGGAEGDAGRPASGGSVRRRTGTRRSSWAAPGGEGEAVASNKDASVIAGEDEGKGRGGESGVQGVEAALRRRREASQWLGDAGRQPGGVAPTRAPCVVPPLPTGRGWG